MIRSSSHFFLLTIILLSISELLSAQLSNDKTYKISIKPSISSVSTVEDVFKASLYRDYKVKNTSYGFDLNYKFSSKIDLGLYASYSRLLHPYKSIGSIGYSFSSSNAFFYGINTEIHLIPLLFHVNNSKIDIYTTIKIGMVSEYYHPYIENVMDPQGWLSKNSFELGLGLGVSYMLTNRLGVFVEYNVGKFYNDDFTRLRTGIKISL